MLIHGAACSDELSKFELFCVVEASDLLFFVVDFGLWLRLAHPTLHVFEPLFGPCVIEVVIVAGLMGRHGSFDAGLFDIDFNLDLVCHQVIPTFCAVLRRFLVEHAIGGV